MKHNVGKNAKYHSRKNYVFFGVLLVGIAFIFIGIHRGEADTVISKAVTICLECIGIG